MQNRIIVVAGMRGSGKSTFASEVILQGRYSDPNDESERLTRPHSGVLCCDPNEDEAYDFIPNTVYSVYHKEGVTRGSAQDKSLEGFLDWAAREKKTRYAVRFIPDEYDEREGMFTETNEFCREIFARCPGSIVCLEEIHQAATNPSPSACPPQIRKIINRGRHRGIDIVACTLRFAECPTPLRAGANFYVIYGQHERNDVDELQRRVGPEATDDVQRLKEFQCVIFNTMKRTWRVATYDLRSQKLRFLSEEKHGSRIPASLTRGEGDEGMHAGNHGADEEEDGEERPELDETRRALRP